MPSLLSFLIEERLKNDDHRENDSETAKNLSAKYPLLFKKRAWRTEENIDHGSAFDEKRRKRSFLERSEDLIMDLQEKLTPLHKICSRSEPYFFMPKGDMERASSFSVHFLTIRVQIELKFRRSETMLLKTLRLIEVAEVWICRDLPGSLFNLGVCFASKLTFVGDTTESDIGKKIKKEFPSSHKLDMFSLIYNF